MAERFKFSADVLALAKGVKVLFLDVDGVFTTGEIYYSDAGEAIKTFNTLDGFGLRLLQLANIIPVVISGRDSAALRARLKDLCFEHAHLGVTNKERQANETLLKLGLGWDQAACMGDDWPDLPMLMPSRLACAPPNAHTEVKSRADFITKAQGGRGALRELCDLLLISNGHYQTLLNSYI